MNDEFCIVSFDFDDTLCYESSGWYGRELIAIPKYVDVLKEYHALGCKCIILTARTPTNMNISEVMYFLHRYDLKHIIKDIHYTSHKPKGPFAKELNVSLHYDDSSEHLESLAEHKIKTIKVPKMSQYEENHHIDGQASYRIKA